MLNIIPFLDSTFLHRLNIKYHTFKISDLNLTNNYEAGYRLTDPS